MSRNVRIKDIAEMAGVSEGTVDRVIHNRGSVSPKVEKRIKNILKKTGYTPNPIAHSLGTAKDYQIAVMMPNPGQDPYWEMAKNGVERAQKEWASYHMHIKLFTFDLYDPDSFRVVSEQLLAENPDAICTVPMFYEASLHFYEKLYKKEIPYTLFNTQMINPIKKLAPLSFIGPDLYHSGCVAAELMNLVIPAPQNIAIMHIHENVDISVHLKKKESGFRDYFENKEIDCNISSHSFLKNHQPFEEQISPIIANNTFDGIFVSTSSSASITAQAMQQCKKEDICLIGFDLLKQNIEFLKDGTINFLINQNPQFQTYGGIRYLVNNILFDEDVPSIRQLPIEIITKENYKSFLNGSDDYLV